MPVLTRRHLLAISAAAMVLPSAAMAQGPQVILRAAFDNWRAIASMPFRKCTLVLQCRAAGKIQSGP